MIVSEILLSWIASVVIEITDDTWASGPEMVIYSGSISKLPNKLYPDLYWMDKFGSTFTFLLILLPKLK